MTEEDVPPPRTKRALEPFVGIRVRRLQSLLQARWVEWISAKAPGMTPAQGGVLLMVQENPGISQGELASLLRIEAPSLTQTLTPLIRRQFIERRPGARDRRVAVFSLTPAGEALAHAVATDAAGYEAVLLGALSSEERKQLIGFLDRVLADLDPPEEPTPVPPARPNA